MKQPKFEKKVLERHVKEAVKKHLDEIGAYHHWPVMYGIGQACLDCHGCYKGMYFAIETKAPGKSLTPRQAVTVKRIVDAGGLVFVIDNIEAARKLLAYER